MCVWMQSPGYKTGLTAVDAFLLFARASRLPTEVNPWRSQLKSSQRQLFPHTKKIELGSDTKREGRNGEPGRQGRKTTCQIIINEPTPPPGMLHHMTWVACSYQKLPLYRSISPHAPYTWANLRCGFILLQIPFYRTDFS